MDKFFKILQKISDGISNWLTNISMISVIIWPIIVFVYVILRSFNICWLFVEEFTKYWLVLIVFFSLTYTLKTKSHISVDIVVKYLPQKVRKILEIVTMILSFLVVLYSLDSSINFLKSAIKYKIYSCFPSHVVLWPIYSVVPIGFISLGLEMFIEIYYKSKELFAKKVKG